MKVKLLLSFFLLLKLTTVQAQKQSYNWFFGENCGVTFNTVPPSTLSNGQMSNAFGSATMSTPAGRMLFYTDGQTVWDSTHNIVPNGTGINSTTYESGATVIVPRPDSAHIYYIFTVSAFLTVNGNYSKPNFFTYSEFNMKLNGGKGDIVSTKKSVYLMSDVCMKLTAVEHANGYDFWVVVSKFKSDSLMSYKVSSSGVNTNPVISKSGIKIATDVYDAFGVLKISPNGKKLAYSNYRLDTLVLADFNVSNGKASNFKTTVLGYAFGLEFSPNSKVLYVIQEVASKLTQYDAYASTSSDLSASYFVVDSFNNLSSFYGNMQLAPNGKIYYVIQYANFLGVIHSPDSLGFNCLSQSRNLALSPKRSGFSLPNCITSYLFKRDFKYEHNCSRDTTIFTLSDTNYVDSIRWSFGDPGSGSKNISRNKTRIYHVYSNPGNVTVTAICYSKNNRYIDTLRKTFYVHQPTVRLGNDTTFCNNVNMFLNSGSTQIYKSYLWSNGSVKRNILATLKGTYSLKVKDSIGCTAADTIVIKKSVLKTGFAIDDTAKCLNGNLFAVRDTSKFLEDEWKSTQWYFGDGTQFSDTFAYKHYADSGHYIIKMLINSKAKCKDSISKKIEVYPKADIKFNINQADQCFKGHRFDLSNQSQISNGNLQYQWYLGDGDSSVNKDIIGKKYSIDSQYRVTLISITDKNCKDTLNKIINVWSDPKPDFNINKTKQCFKGNAFDFTSLTVIKSGSIADQIWSFGNGDTSHLKQFSKYTYITEDSFDVRHIAVSDKGCRDTITKQVITFAQPIAEYTVPNDSQCWQKNAFKIINKTRLKYGSMQHQWDFGDGTFDTTFLVLNKHYPNLSAQYKIVYSVVSDHNCADTLTHMVHLLERPISKFEINDSIQCFNGHLFDFVNTTNFSAMSTLTYNWDYGNGDTSIGFNANQKTYNSSAYYNVQLISNSYLNGCSDTFGSKILVAPQAVPDFVVDKDSQCLRFNAFALEDKSTVAFGKFKAIWDFGDGIKGYSSDTVKTYKAGTSFMAKRYIETNFNCKDTVSKPLILLPHPIAAFIVNDSIQCLNAHDFSFTNQSSVAYGHLMSKWIFDDLNTDTNLNISSKQFTTANFHKILLAMSTEHDCADTITSRVYLEKDHNVGSVFISNDTQCLKGNQFKMEAKSNDNQIVFSTYNWTLGDGQTNTSKDINFKYKDSGHYQIQLVVSTANACFDTADANAVVHLGPKAGFTVNSPCWPEASEFKDTSKGSIVSREWLFHDMSSSKISNPIKYYPSAGFYSASLIVNSDFGCKDTVSKTNAVLVRSRPKALFDFEFLPSRTAGLTTLQFRNMSSSDVIAQEWDYNQGNTSGDKNPIIDFEDSNSRVVTLMVSNQEGCSDTFKLKTGQLIPTFYYFAPSAFTPNSDQLNEVYKPFAMQYVYSFEMEIFNRWGERVFATSDINEAWDGTYQGELCQEGVYLCRVYIVPLRGQLFHREFSITLLR